MDTGVGEKKLEEITSRIIKEYQPERIILFGSFAWGEPNQDSDLDLFVIKKSEKSRMERERELSVLLSPHTVPIDILVYTPEEVEQSINEYQNLFVEDIVRNGRLLYEIPGSKIRIKNERALTIVQ